MGKNKEKRKASRTDQDVNRSIIKKDSQIPEGMELFFAGRKTIKQLCAPGGVNPNPLDHMEIDDNGQLLYTMCFYIDKLPIRTKFAQTFAGLFNFPDVTSCVFIDPMTDGKSSKKLDKRVNMLSTEQVEAEKGDRNRWRKVTKKLNDTEAFAVEVESGDNMLYEVAFLFILQSITLEGLHLMANDFHARGKETGIELSACYSVHPEAFISGYPTNRIFKASALNGFISTTTIKKHVLDKGSLGDIYNHTRSGFSHKDGIALGHNMHTGAPFTFDPYDKSHDGYGVVVSGKTHSGKSATIKIATTRLIDFKYKIRSIDFDAVGVTGEYGAAASAVGGVNYQIKPRSENILNLFEVNAEIDLDEHTKKEFPALHLTAKKADLKNLIMTMIKNGHEIDQFAAVTFIESIVEDIVDELYNRKGIFDGVVTSLYYKDKVLGDDGTLRDGRVKKSLPTISEFYKELLRRKKDNTDDLYRESYAVTEKAMRKYVRELVYCPHCLQEFTAEQFYAMEQSEERRVCPHCKQSGVQHLKGTRPYFDGQSTIQADEDTPWINIDISQLPPGDKVIGLLVAMNFTQENYIKKNSVNPKKAQKMIMLVDEVHETFPYEEARLFIANAYRTYRKRHVSPWTATQALADYKGYEETEAILKNAACIFMLKQARQDREFLQQATPLTDAQIDDVFSLGGTNEDTDEKRRGEVCVIDGDRVQFIQVDYLTDTESLVVETDTEKMKKMYRGKVGV